jgi:hypothetical protein
MTKTHQLFDDVKKFLNLTCLKNPDFIYKAGFWVDDQHHDIAVIPEIGVIEVRNPSNIDEVLLLGAYCTNQPNQLTIFIDEVQSRAERYANAQSIFYLNGKRIDARTDLTHGFDGKPNGLKVKDARDRILSICIIDLSIRFLLQNAMGNWSIGFYNKSNKHHLDLIIHQLTKKYIEDKPDLSNCFDWLHINSVSSSKFEFNIPLILAKVISESSDSDWDLIYGLDSLIDFFDLHNKVHSQELENFIQNKVTSNEEEFFKRITKHSVDPLIAKKLLNESNKTKYKTRKSGINFGLTEEPPKGLGWWKTWS